MSRLGVLALILLLLPGRAVAGRKRGRAAARRDADLRCQIRWWWQHAPTSRFYASYIDAEGIEHRLAWSPWFAWRWPFPPDESHRPRKALEQLVWELVQAGWEPLGQTGTDYDEERWYALVFRAAPGQSARTLRIPS
jgi:hypothetical protein